MNSPLVSIICTNYNKEKWISRAIEGFLAQEADFDFEILIIDDASTDNSIRVIEGFVKENPERIRFFKNEENLGITKTWKKICLEARGKYIARCDGDDYWFDNRKLQKQVDLLAKTGKKWSNSDFDMIDEDGRVVAEKCFLNKSIARPESFVDILTTLGFTMASTWLVEADLMREVNARIDDLTADDTFNIQLELFRETEIAFLADSTTVYRVNSGSDSRPVEFEKVEARYKKLLQTQLGYSRYLSGKEKTRAIEKLLSRTHDLELLSIGRGENEKNLQAENRNLKKEIELLRRPIWRKIFSRIRRIIGKVL